MEFNRKRVAGRNQKTYKEWLDETGHYRIVWRTEFMGLEIPPQFHATVKINGPAGEYWDFVGRRAPYKTFNKAVEAAAKHRKVWLQLITIAETEYKGRADRIRALEARARGSTKDGNYRLMLTLPAWMEGKVPLSILSVLWSQKRSNSEDDQPSPTPASKTSVAGTTPSAELDSSSIPAPSATDSARSGAPTRSRRKANSGPASSATAVAASPRPKLAKPIKRRSKRGEKTALSTSV